MNTNQEGRLFLANGASHLRLLSNSSQMEWVTTRFEGSVPRVDVVNGSVTVRYPRLFFDWRRHKAEITLRGSIGWKIHGRLGIAEMFADLRQLNLLEMSFTGGISEAEVLLPPPVGEVAIRLTGGVSQMKLYKPEGVGTRIEMKGGASQLELDRQHFGSVAGLIRVENPEFHNARDRYVIHLTGGVSVFSIQSRV